MAMRKLLSQRVFNVSKMASQGLMNCRISSSSLAVRTRVPKEPGEATVDPEPADSWMDMTMMKMPFGESLREKLRENDRIRLDGLLPPPVKHAAAAEKTEALGLTVRDVKKLLRAAQIEVVKTKLMETGKSWISYNEFVGLCNDSCLDPAQGPWIAKMLDDSGNVIVLGDYVCLRPDQVMIIGFGI